MNREDILEKIRSALMDQDEDTVNEYVEKALENGVEPIDILNNGLAAALQELGELFAEEEIFLPELLVSADITIAIMKKLEGKLKGFDKMEKRGTILLATVEGDVHDIGKSLVAMIMKACGYEVIDAGTDVPNTKLIELVKEHKPDLVGLSALLLTTMTSQSQFIEMAKEAGIRDQIKIMLGGAPVSRDWAMKVGADGFSEDASAAVIEADKLMGINA